MRADRLIALVLLLQARGRMTTRALAERLEVSRRTVLRDLDALSAAGVPVYTDSGPGGGVSLPDGYRLDLTALNAAEAGALLLSAVPGPLADLGVGRVLEGALRKFSAALPPVAVQEAARARERVHLDPAEWWQTHEPTPHLAVLHDAVWRDRRLRLAYRRRDGKQRERVVEPLGLVAKASVWYLVAAEESDVRVFRVARLLDAAVVDEPARRPVGFELAEFWARWRADFEATLPRYPVMLRVAPALLAELPQFLGEGVRALVGEVEREGEPDERGWLPVPLVFESLEKACARVLAFGPLAEVVSPGELRLRVAAQAAQIAARYVG